MSAVNFVPNFFTIDECLDWLKEKKFIRRGMDLGLARMKLACRLLNHPEKKQNTIHIAGTNGKGSTVTFLASICQSSELQVGTFTSPHLDSWNEMIKVNNIPISNQDFFVSTEQIINKLEDKVKPTTFEFLTIVAFYYFTKIKPIDLAIYEVGLGGKRDATNVILPLACGITNIDYDHFRYLGNDLISIAQKKAGIIKKNSPCFTTETKPQILLLLRKVAQGKKSKLHQVSSAKEFNFDRNKLIMSFYLITKHYTFYLKTKMLGQHQIKNISLAVYIALHLRKKFSQITQSNIEKGIEAAFWPNRMELVNRDPLLFLDGAHNQSGIKSLIKTLKTFFFDKKIVFLVSIMKDKQVSKMLNNLKKIACQIIFTEANGSRKQEVDRLEKNNTTKFRKIADCSKAFFYFYSLLDSKKIGIITGSLHFVSHIKKEFLTTINQT